VGEREESKITFVTRVVKPVTVRLGDEIPLPGDPPVRFDFAVRAKVA
jgi:hypothetical protein